MVFIQGRGESKARSSVYARQCGFAGDWRFRWSIWDVVARQNNDLPSNQRDGSYTWFGLSPC